jgi:hypothetical protein
MFSLQDFPFKSFLRLAHPLLSIQHLEEHSNHAVVKLIAGTALQLRPGLLAREGLPVYP